MPPKVKKEKLKYFLCPVCNKIETQDLWVISVEHNHGGKIVRSEEVKNEKGEKMPQPRVDPKGPKRSKWVDGITGVPVV